ncbi:guanylate kinase [Roseimarinus sediminis]|uniref:guanylate kinase n=1 Tax=Roseimarinus sediminis TaxID=1610899 RepID=UPI003D1DE201
MLGKLIIFSAPSGSGKTTIVQHLLSLGLGLEFSVSATSRPIRGNEQDGKDYYFLSADEFRNKIDRDEFLEWEEVYKDRYYGTLKSEVERIRKKGKHVIFDVDVVGGSNIKAYYGDEALSVFVQPPSIEELEKRLHARSTDAPEVIATRVEKAAFELTFAPKFDVILINDQLGEALHQAENIVKTFLDQ